MKTYKYLLGLGVAAMSLSSCSNDTIDAPDTPQVADKDMTKYIALSITSNDPKSRAAYDYNPASNPNFADGTETESAIKSCYLVFYDDKGNVVGDLVNVSGLKDLATPGGSVETAKGKVVQVSIPKGQVEPSFVMCYINPQSINALTQPLSTLEILTRTDFSNGMSGNDFAFSMSNSVYYEGTSGNAKRAAAIGEGMLFTTVEDANIALSGDDPTKLRVNIYVERYAAKVELSVAENAIQAFSIPVPKITDSGIEANGNLSLTFNRVGWDVNSANKSTFVSKIFREQASLGQIGGKHMDYNAVNNLLTTGRTGTWMWNNGNYHRCYWANSPAYYTDNFPEVASDVLAAREAAKEDEGKALPLYYYSYNNLRNRAETATENTRTDQIRWADYRYKLESTMGTNCFKSNNPAASIPSLVITGYYTFGEATEGQTFYTYNPYNNETPFICSPEDQSINDADGNPIPSVKDLMFHNITTLFYNTADDETIRPVNLSVLETLGVAFTVTRPTTKVIAASKYGTEATPKLASRKATLQITNLNLLPNGVTLYVASGNGRLPVSNIENSTTDAYSLTDANAILLNDVKFADQYTDGCAYFYKPIVHLGFYADGNANMSTVATDGPVGGLKNVIDWDNVRVGDFGLVRNHSYDLSVTKIGGLGIAIRTLDDPIVPPADTKQLFMAMQVNIMQWALVPQQVIEF